MENETPAWLEWLLGLFVLTMVGVMIVLAWSIAGQELRDKRKEKAGK